MEDINKDMLEVVKDLELPEGTRMVYIPKTIIINNTQAQYK